NADRDHLRRVVPLVDRGGYVEPFVALQADETAAERRGEHLGDLGRADAGLALQEQRTVHPEGEKEHGRERAVGEIVGAGEQLQGVVDRGRQRFLSGLVHGGNLTPNPAVVPAKAGTQSCKIRGPLEYGPRLSGDDNRTFHVTPSPPRPRGAP